MLLLPADLLLAVFDADDKVRPIRGKAHRHARVLRFSGADEHAVILDQLPPVLQQREKAVLVQKELDPVPVFGMNETVGVALGIDEEILALFQNLELTAFAACGKLGIMGRAAVNVIDQVIVRRQRFGNLGKGDILMLKLLPGKLRPDLFIDVFDADEDMLPVPGQNFDIPDVSDRAVHDQTVGNGIGAPVLQILQHRVLVVETGRLLLIIRVHISADASPALGEEVLPGGRHIQLFVIIRRRDLGIGAGVDIHIVERVIMIDKTGGNLRVNCIPACRRRHILFRASVFYEVCILGCHRPHLTKAVGIVYIIYQFTIISA